MRNGVIGDTISDSKMMSAMGLSYNGYSTIIGALFGADYFLFLAGCGIHYGQFVFAMFSPWCLWHKNKSAGLNGKYKTQYFLT